MSEDRISHAYMLVAPEGPAREEAATRLAASMVCVGEHRPCGACAHCRKAFAHIHPDIITVGREAGKDGKARQNIVVDQVRSITADAVIAPNEARRKVYIFDQADRLNTAAQNALLKSLEEPAGHACYILCTVSAEALLPTVRSRCVQRTPGGSEPAHRVSEEAMRYLAFAAGKDYAGLVQFCMSLSAYDREQTDLFLQDTLSAAADVLCGRVRLAGAETGRLLHVAELIRQMQDWLRHNVSVKQIFTVLAVKTMR